MRRDGSGLQRTQASARGTRAESACCGTGGGCWHEAEFEQRRWYGCSCIDIAVFLERLGVVWHLSLEMIDAYLLQQTLNAMQCAFGGRAR
jgi:hypothetical protein